MTRVLVLGESGIVVPDEAVETIEAINQATEAGLWLPGLLDTNDDATPREVERRVLRLRDGGRVEVPAMMSIEEVEILTLPPLLQPLATSTGVIGITALADRLGLVCDPRLLPLGDKEGELAP